MEFGHCTNETNRLATFLSSWYCSWKKYDWLQHHFHFLSTECHSDLYLVKNIFLYSFLSLFFIFTCSLFQLFFYISFHTGLKYTFKLLHFNHTEYQTWFKKKKTIAEQGSLQGSIIFFLYPPLIIFLTILSQLDLNLFTLFSVELLVIGKIWTVLRT